MNSAELKEHGEKLLGLNKLEDIVEEDQEVKLNQVEINDDIRSDFVPEEGKFTNKVNTVMSVKSPAHSKNFTIQNEDNALD